MDPQRAVDLLGQVGEGLKRARAPERKAPRRTWKPWAAAAAVLLAAGIWKLSVRPAPAPPVAVAPSKAAPGQALEAGPKGLRLVWEDGGWARLSPSARAVPGFPLVLEKGEVRARLRGVELCRNASGLLKGNGDWVELLMREAGAAEVLSGEAVWVPAGGGEPVPLKPAKRTEAGRPSPFWSGSGAEGDYAFEAEVEASPGSGWGVAFRSSSGTRLWVLSPELRAGRTIRVGIRRWGGRYVGEASGRVAWTCPEGDEALLRFPTLEGKGTAGIAAWGAPVKVLQALFVEDTAPVLLVEGGR